MSTQDNLLTLTKANEVLTNRKYAAALDRLNRNHRQALEEIASKGSEVGKLSAKQWQYLEDLVVRVQELAAEAAKQEHKDTVRFPVLRGFLMRSPGKVRFLVRNQVLQFKYAGVYSSQPHTFAVTHCRTHEIELYLGRLGLQAEWLPNQIGKAAGYLAALAEIARAPDKAAAEYGHATGQCSFCARPLSDDRSVAVGYGPVCAVNFNLPWGETDMYLTDAPEDDTCLD